MLRRCLIVASTAIALAAIFVLYAHPVIARCTTNGCA